MDLEMKMDQAIWVAKQLFDRGKTTGSSANLSFRDGEHMYISGTNTSFGSLTKESFSKMDLNGNHIEGIKPSKEFPLHLTLYKMNSDNTAVIHTHSHYSTLISCLNLENEGDAIPNYTPYLGMKLGKIKLIDYFKPGSKELFMEFEKQVDGRNGYLLKNHGPIVADKNMESAFYSLEELEESATIAWDLMNSQLNSRLIED